MKKIFSLTAFTVLITLSLGILSVPVGAAVDNPYGTTAVGCITDVIINSNTDLGGVNYFNGEVKSYYQGVETKRQYRYDVYGAVGSKESKLFVYSYGNSSNQSYANHSVQDMVERFEQENPSWNVIAATNGDFFDIETKKTSDLGEPEGPMIQNGDIYKPHSTGATGRGAVGVTADGEVVYSVFGSKYYEEGYGIGLTILSSGYTLKILGEHKTNAIRKIEVKHSTSASSVKGSFITPDSKSGNYEGHTVAVIKCDTYRRAHIGINGEDLGTRGFFLEGEVTEIRQGKAKEKAEDGYVILAIPEDPNYDIIKVGTAVKLQNAIMGGKWAEVENAIGFKQLILAEGNILLKDCFFSQDSNTWTDADRERFAEKTQWTEDTVYAGAWKNRTALGFKADGSAVLLVSGKEKDYKTGFGASYYELGEQLKALGCVNGFALDGGGSSTFVIRNEDGSFSTVFGSESAKGRSVANAVILAVRDENVPLPVEDEVLEDIPFTPTPSTVTKRTTEATTITTVATSDSDTALYSGCGSMLSVMPVGIAAVAVCGLTFKRRKKNK